jgi:hypothetical protein
VKVVPDELATALAKVEPELINVAKPLKQAPVTLPKPLDVEPVVAFYKLISTCCSICFFFKSRIICSNGTSS